jgi:hypothetical protein
LSTSGKKKKEEEEEEEEEEMGVNNIAIYPL